MPAQANEVFVEPPSPSLPSIAPPTAPLAEDDPALVRGFVEHYLVTRGYAVSTRNARIVTAALCTCTEPLGVDWSPLERHVDAVLDPSAMPRAA